MSMSTKQEHKRAARERREGERQRALRRARLRKIGSAAAIFVVVGVALVWVLRPGKVAAPTSAAMGDLLSNYPTQAKAAGCSVIKDADAYLPPDQDHGHIGQDGLSAPSLASYPTVPPTSGPHSVDSQGAGVLTSPPDIYKTLHSLEHGAVVLFYSPDTGPSALKEISSFVRSYQDHVILAPYDYPSEGEAATLPQESPFALVAWHKTQYCSQVPGTAVLANFISKYRNPTLGGGSFQGADDVEKGPGGAPLPI
jgi:hypothetical protein